jgi:hypothetical protein
MHDATRTTIRGREYKGSTVHVVEHKAE